MMSRLVVPLFVAFTLPALAADNGAHHGHHGHHGHDGHQAPPAAAAPAHPGMSLFQLGTTVRAQDGSTVDLASFKGAPVFITMFYASCPNACPAIIASLKRVEMKLPEKQRARARFVLVSFDPVADTPEKLTALAGTYRLDGARWTLGTTSDAATQELAAALGIRFKRHPDGNYTHTSLITLLDADGVPVASTEDMPGAAEELVPRVK